MSENLQWEKANEDKYSPLVCRDGAETIARIIFDRKRLFKVTLHIGNDSQEITSIEILDNVLLVHKLPQLAGKIRSDLCRILNGFSFVRAASLPNH